MGGKKNKAKRKESSTVRKRLQDHHKNNAEIKKSLQTIQKVRQDEKDLEVETAKLSKREEKLQTTRQESHQLQREINEVLGTTLFEEISKNTNPTATPKKYTISITDYEKALVNVNQVNIHLKRDLRQEERRYASWYNAFIGVLEKMKIAKEKADLLLSSDENRSSVDLLIKQKMSSELKLEELKTNLKSMTRLDVARQQDHPDLTLEEYLTLRHNRSSKSIEEFRKLLKNVNEKSKKIQKELEKRRWLTNKIIEDIKQDNIASVEDHKRYKAIVEENKKLMDQLEELNKKRTSIAEEKNHALAEIEREKQRVYEESEDRIDIEESIKKLLAQNNENENSEAKHREILEAAKENWVGDIALKHEKINIAALTERIFIEKQAVRTRRDQLEEVKNYNDKILKYVEDKSHKMVKDFHDDMKLRLSSVAH